MKDPPQNKSPMPEIIKMNIDGAFLADQKKVSWIFIARDNEGSAVMADAGSTDVIHDA